MVLFAENDISLFKGGGDGLENFQHLCWRTNREKGDSWPITPKNYCSLDNQESFLYLFTIALEQL